jgi:hypothetical protein
MDDTSMDEIVGLLSKISPKTLEDLTRQYPTHWKLFRPGKILGKGIPAQILLTATGQSLKQILPWADGAIERTRGKLQVARFLELIGSCIALVGSGTAVIFASMPGAQARTVVAAALAVSGNLCVAGANYFRGSLLGGKHTLIEAYSTLMRTRPELGFLNSQITALLEIGLADASDRDVKTLVNRTQLLCKEIYAATKDIPGSEPVETDYR